MYSFPKTLTWHFNRVGIWVGEQWLYTIRVPHHSSTGPWLSQHHTTIAFVMTHHYNSDVQMWLMAIVMPQLSFTQFLLVRTVTQCINMVDVISGQPLCKEIQHNNFHFTPGWTSTCGRSWEIDVAQSSTPHQPGTSTKHYILSMQKYNLLSSSSPTSPPQGFQSLSASLQQNHSQADFYHQFMNSWLAE